MVILNPASCRLTNWVDPTAKDVIGLPWKPLTLLLPPKALKKGVCMQLKILAAALICGFLGIVTEIGFFMFIAVILGGLFIFLNKSGGIGGE